MKTFKELNKLGYKHYTDNTVEELDSLPLYSNELIIERTFVLKWFEDNHSIFVDKITETNVNEILGFTFWLKSWRFPPIEIGTYLDTNEGVTETINKLIELLKTIKSK